MSVPKARQRAEAAALWAELEDLFPRGMTGLRAGAHDPDPAYRRGQHRWVLPRPETKDHWDTVALARPYAYLDLGPGPRALAVGIQTDGEAGADEFARLLDDDQGERLGRFLDAAGRFDHDAETATLAISTQPRTPAKSRVLRGHSCPTADLAPEMLATLIALARDPPAKALRGHETPALRLVHAPLDPEDRTRRRRQVRRVVDLWAPIHTLPAPRGPPPKKRELEARLRRLYPRTLLLLGSGLDPQALARVRVEARELDRHFREAGGSRPRMMDQVLERLGLQTPGPR